MNQTITNILKRSGFPVIHEDQNSLYLRGNYKGITTVIYADENKKKVMLVSSNFPGENKKKYSYSELLAKHDDR